MIAYSRARYAKTREEVERQIGEMMGWAPPAFAGDDPAVAEGKRQAFKAMTDLGMPKDQALDLLSRFDLGAVERQIAWLPSRGRQEPGPVPGRRHRRELRHAAGPAPAGGRTGAGEGGDPERGAQVLQEELGSDD